MDKEVNISLTELNQMRDDCKKQIALAESLERLHNNKDFKKVFLDEYMDKEPARLVNLLGEQSFNLHDKRELYRQDLQERMVGIARFAEFIRNTMSMANRAKQTLDQLAEAESNMEIKQ